MLQLILSILQLRTFYAHAYIHIYIGDYSIVPDHMWNQLGNGMAQTLKNYPIIRADNSETLILLNLCEENHQNDYQLTKVHSAELTFYMGKGDLTSLDCLAWRDIDGNRDPQCLPLGGQSIWGSLNSLDERPKIVLTAAFDSTAEFHQLATGANDAMSSLAAVMIIAEALSRISSDTLQRQPMIFLANADEWGFSGSRRFVRDLYAFTCTLPIGASSSASGLPFCLDPIYPNTLFQKIKDSDIDMVIALDQIGVLDSSDTLYMHHQLIRSSGINPTQLEELQEDTVNSLYTIAVDLEIGVQEVEIPQNGAIPPTPLTSFIRGAEELSNSSFLGVTITGYGSSSFIDPSYHTRLDEMVDSSSMKENIFKASRLVLAMVLSVSGISRTAVSINDDLADSLVDCLYYNWTCSVLKPYIDSELSNLNEYITMNEEDEGVDAFTDDILTDIPVWDYEPPTQVHVNTSQVTSFYSGILSSSVQPIVNLNGKKYGRLSTDILWEDDREAFSEEEGIYDKSMDKYTWNKENNKIYAVPNTLEGLIRGFLSFHLSSDRFSSSTVTSCKTSSDCSRNDLNVTATCSIGFYTSVVKECIQEECVCPGAFYHLAMDTGIEADETPGWFNPVGPQVTLLGSGPTSIYCEAIWSRKVGVRLYTDASHSIGLFSLCFGLAVAVISAIVVYNHDHLEKSVII